MFDLEDIKKLKSLKLRTLLDLALLVPNGYEDNTLSSKIEIGKNLIAKATVLQSIILNGRLQVKFFLEDFNKEINAIFFKTTPYHQKLFSVGKSLVISGKVGTFRGILQITQPKSIKSFNKIIPKYKTKLKQSDVVDLITKYITKQNLLNAGLTQNETEAILNLHFPKSLSDIKQEGEFLPHILNALKSVEIYNHLIKLRKKKVLIEPICALNGSFEPFIKNLPFTLTNDQLKAINEIKKDLSNSKKAARRIIIGDVGSGKTMVILAAAMIAGSKKSILMAPTSILANQLYSEAKNYLNKFLNIAFVSQKETIGDINSADFIIGTHALLYKKLPSVALVMIDEQHRFGTNQRALLDNLVRSNNKAPHFLQFSATPIPRTQAMIESETIDISIIKQLPFKKQIETKIISKSDFSALLEHIENEINKKHQVLIVYPLVEPSDEVPYASLQEAAPFWQKRFSSVYITYGKDKTKDEVLIEFKEKGNILLSTTVIEVGISLPRLTTIVIVGAERFGLATLHQLRGRVGRYGIDSYCFLYTNLQKAPKRLIEFSNTLDGFEIARLDLKYRNSGDLLDGTTQSGKMFKWLDLSEDEDIILNAKERVKRFFNI
jgi:ATP-dependent DNA helicase RecG